MRNLADPRARKHKSHQSVYYTSNNKIKYELIPIRPCICKFTFASADNALLNK